MQASSAAPPWQQQSAQPSPWSNPAASQLYAQQPQQMLPQQQQQYGAMQTQAQPQQPQGLYYVPQPQPQPQPQAQAQTPQLPRVRLSHSNALSNTLDGHIIHLTVLPRFYPALFIEPILFLLLLKQAWVGSVTQLIPPNYGIVDGSAFYVHAVVQGGRLPHVGTVLDNRRGCGKGAIVVPFMPIRTSNQTA